MPSIKEYNNKLTSLKNTVKITRTMKMVSASKLRRAQDKQKDASDYAEEVNQLIHQIAGGVELDSHPLLTPRADVKKVLLLVFTSDKGLCGGFNNNLIRFVRLWMEERTDLNVTISCCGRRANNYFADRSPIDTHYENVTAKPDPLDARRISNDVCSAFVAGTYDVVYLVYNKFISPLSQVPHIEPLLPMEKSGIPLENADVARDFIAEPPIDKLLDKLIPKLVVFKILYALLENSAGEHGARMTAMDNATSNANSLIDDYTLRRNRARQAAITTELIEIISGAEAL